MVRGVIVILLACLAGCTRRETIGGRWELQTWTGPPEAGNVHLSLYRRANGRRIRVDEFVGPHRYYGDDCLVYETSSGPKNRQYYAACGDREPVLLASESHEEWLMDDTGLQKMEWVTEAGQLEKRPGARILWAEIKGRAMAQPPFREDWRKDRRQKP